ncbi:MAG: hypothetical protein RR482_04925 [Clostridia bacterium]
MRKNGLIWILALLLLFGSAMPAFALEVTNRDLQLGGGLAAVNEEDTFFFALTGEKEWGLYTVSGCKDGPMATFQDKTPSRLLYANKKKVYYLAIGSDNRYTLESVEIGGGSSTTLLENIAVAFVENGSTFLYTTGEDPNTLLRFDIEKGKSSKLKSMKSKSIWDACETDGTICFLTHDANNSEAGYQINKQSGKAVNMPVPSPKSGSGMLYEGYLIYTPAKDNSKVYAMPIGSKKKATRMGEKLASVTLATPRLGTSLYPYDEETNTIYRLPLDGSDGGSMKMNSEKLDRYLVGGNSKLILVWDNGQICRMDPELSAKSDLFPFDLTTDGMQWSNLVPVNGDMVLIMGYTPMTYSSVGKTLPTAVRVVDTKTSETVFYWPEPAAPKEAEVPGDPPPDPPADPNEVKKAGTATSDTSSDAAPSAAPSATSSAAPSAAPSNGGESNGEKKPVSDEEDSFFKDGK